MTEQPFVQPPRSERVQQIYDQVVGTDLESEVIYRASRRIIDDLETTRAADGMRIANLERMQLTDYKTGLANYEGFMGGIEQAIQLPEVQSGQAVVDVIVMDLDHFKNVNEGLGHPAGDQALRVVAETLSGYGQRTGDVVAHGMRGARLGGDEFGLLSITRRQDVSGQRLQDATSSGDIAYVPGRVDPLKPVINDQLAQSFAGTPYEQYDLSLSVGRARYKPGLNPEMLLAEADAMARIDKHGPRKDRIVSGIMSDEDRNAFISDMLVFDKYEQRRPEPAVMAAEELGIALPPPSYQSGSSI